MKKTLLLIIIAALAAALGYRYYVGQSGQLEVVDQAYVKTNLGKPGVVLVDVRAEEIYNGKSPRQGIPGGHIPGAINFPLSNLTKADAADALAKAGITKDAEVIVYCNTGNQSGTFAGKLVEQFGFDPAKVKNYRGSVTDWAKDPANQLEPEGHE